MKTMKIIIASGLFLAISLFMMCLIIDTEVFGQELLVKKWIKKLDWSNASEAKIAYNRLLAKGEDAVPYLIKSLSDNFENTSIRANCADILGRLKSKEAIPALIDALSARRFRIRYTAAIALGRIGDNSAVPALIRHLKDPDVTVQQHVISALRNINDKNAGPALVKMLQDRNPSIRLLTAQVLVDFGTKEARPAFIKILEETWDIREIRQLAASGLGKIDGEGAVEALSKSLLRDPNYLVRADCAVALGELGNKKAIPYLIKALSDEYKNVTSGAASSLSQITGKQLGFDSDKWRKWFEAGAK